MATNNTVDRAADIARIIPRPPNDIAPLRNAFSRLVANQWEKYLPSVTNPQSIKARFIAGMYARACYSMLLVSASRSVRVASMLPLSRSQAIPLAMVLLTALNRLIGKAVHRQLLLTSAMMGAFDGLLDEAAKSGEAAALRTASLITSHPPTTMSPDEQAIATLTQQIRHQETPWQSKYWEQILAPAVQACCEAEVQAIAHSPDPKGMGHRHDGIDSAIKGMWYVTGPCMGLNGSLKQFETTEWNREQRWMADTSLLMQMIDDWVDQDEDTGTRLTPVATGQWSTESAEELYSKTVRDLATMLNENGIRNHVLHQLFLDLYNDYLHTAIAAMRPDFAA